MTMLNTDKALLEVRLAQFEQRNMDATGEKATLTFNNDATLLTNQTKSDVLLNFYFGGGKDTNTDSITSYSPPLATI